MKYRKKPVVIEAVQYTGDNIKDVEDFINNDDILDYDSTGVYIHTLEGTMLANKGDYIIKGVDGEFYPCKPEIFEKTYEPAE